MSAKPEFDLFATGSQTTAQKEASLEQLARRLVRTITGRPCAEASQWQPLS